MFGPSYFGTSYFGPSYFGPGLITTPSPVTPEEELIDGLELPRVRRRKKKKEVYPIDPNALVNIEHVTELEKELGIDIGSHLVDEDEEIKKQLKSKITKEIKDSEEDIGLILAIIEATS